MFARYKTYRISCEKHMSIYMPLIEITGESSLKVTFLGTGSSMGIPSLVAIVKIVSLVKNDYEVLFSLN